MKKEPLHFKLRIPEDLLEKVRERAEKSGRTATGEILLMLERYPELEDQLKERENLEIALKEADDEIYRLRKIEEKYNAAETNSAVMSKIDKLEKDMQNWKEMLHQFGIANGFEPPVETSESPAPEKKATKKK
jgi:DNA repair exonuclease SbcCD ATPase subunit